MKLREVLKPQAEAKVPSQAGSARGSEAGTFTPPKSAQEQFQALTEVGPAGNGWRAWRAAHSPTSTRWHPAASASKEARSQRGFALPIAKQTTSSQPCCFAG